MIASLEGAGAVLSIPVDGGTVSSSVPFGGPVEVDGMSSDEGFFGAGPAMDSRSTRTWITPEGPRGVAFLGDEDAVTYSFLDRKVARITHTSVPANSDHRMSEATLMLEESTGALEASDATEFAPNTLPTDVEEGRRLFFATNDSQMAASGAGISCATCHFDGRNDGLTWVFADEDEGADHFRQTPSLAGVVSMTAPVTWTDDVVSVFEEVMTTSQGRMGGTGLAEADGLKVASFIDWTREPDLPLHGSTSASVLRGKEIFEREDVGCADCHNGAAFTDNEAYDMYGITGVRTRSLIGIAASAPYLHDGSAPTIDAVLVSARDGEMGDTSGLSSGEMKDLADYVKSL
jgi:mono/diheme cytochrome c family protein